MTASAQPGEYVESHLANTVSVYVRRSVASAGFAGSCATAIANTTADSTAGERMRFSPGSARAFESALPAEIVSGGAQFFTRFPQLGDGGANMRMFGRRRIRQSGATNHTQHHQSHPRPET